MPYTAPPQGSGSQYALGQGAGTAVRRAIQVGMDQNQNPDAPLMDSIMKAYGMKPNATAELAKEAGLGAAAAGGGTGGVMGLLKSL